LCRDSDTDLYGGATHRNGYPGPAHGNAYCDHSATHRDKHPERHPDAEQHPNGRGDGHVTAKRHAHPECDRHHGGHRDRGRYGDANTHADTYPHAYPDSDTYTHPHASATDEAYPGATSTTWPTSSLTAQATWTIGPSVTPGPSPSLELGLRPSLTAGYTTTSTPGSAYPLSSGEQSLAFATMPAGTVVQDQSGTGVQSQVRGQMTSIPDAQGIATEPPAQEATLQSLTTPTPDKVAMALSTSIAKGKVTPAPPRSKPRVPQRQYGAFVGISSFLLLLISYALLLRRQRQRSPR
jgi:hypothetical protein